MSAQDEHDYQLAQRKPLQKGSSSRLEASLRKKKAVLDVQSQPELFDPIEAALKNNPGLSRERAMDLAEKFGF